MGKHSKPRATGPGGEFDDLYEQSASAQRPEPALQDRVDAYTAARRAGAEEGRNRDETVQDSVIGRFLGRKK